MRRIAETFGEGFRKYGDDNWKKGFPNSVYFTHAMDHLISFQNGEGNEDDLAHACWNLMAIMWNEKHLPEMCDYPHPRMLNPAPEPKTKHVDALAGPWRVDGDV